MDIKKRKLEVKYSNRQIINECTNCEIKELIDSGYDINMMDEDTLLSAACLFGNIETVKLLLENGALVSGDHEKDSVFQIASDSGNLDLMTLLIEYGADVNALDLWGATPFERAMMDGHEDILLFIAQNGGYGKEGTVVSISNLENDDLRRTLLNYHPLRMRTLYIDTFQSENYQQYTPFPFQEIVRELSWAHISKIAVLDLLLARELCPESPFHRHRFPLDLLKFIFALCEMPFSPKKFAGVRNSSKKKVDGNSTREETKN